MDGKPPSYPVLLCFNWNNLVPYDVRTVETKEFDHLIPRQNTLVDRNTYSG